MDAVHKTEPTEAAGEACESAANSDYNKCDRSEILYVAQVYLANEMREDER